MLNISCGIEDTSRQLDCIEIETNTPRLGINEQMILIPYSSLNVTTDIRITYSSQSCGTYEAVNIEGNNYYCYKI